MADIPKVTVREQSSLHFAVFAANMDGRRGFGGLARREDIVEITIEALRFLGYDSASAEVEVEAPDWVNDQLKIKGYSFRLKG